MSKTITNFICPDCGVIDTLESWGIENKDRIIEDNSYTIEQLKTNLSDMYSYLDEFITELEKVISNYKK